MENQDQLVELIGQGVHPCDCVEPIDDALISVTEKNESEKVVAIFKLWGGEVVEGRIAHDAEPEVELPCRSRLLLNAYVSTMLNSFVPFTTTIGSNGDTRNIRWSISA
ncbi:MAG: hypothetical protein ABH832_01695 [bacterium]